MKWAFNIESKAQVMRISNTYYIYTYVRMYMRTYLYLTGPIPNDNIMLHANAGCQIIFI